HCTDPILSLFVTGVAFSRLTVPGNGTPLSGLAYSPDGRLVAAAGADPTVRVGDATTGREVHALHGHAAAVTWVVFSADGQRLASADLDRIVRLWHVRTGTEDSPGKEPIRLDGPESRGVLTW